MFSDTKKYCAIIASIIRDRDIHLILRFPRFDVKLIFVYTISVDNSLRIYNLTKVPNVNIF